jgi:hypothetical protein
MMVTNSDRQPTQFRDEAPERFELAGSNCQDSDPGTKTVSIKTADRQNLPGIGCQCRVSVASASESSKKLYSSFFTHCPATHDRRAGAVEIVV